MLLTLMEKVSCIQRQDELSWESDSDVDWSSWIDEDLPDEVDGSKDPDYCISGDVGGNAMAIHDRRVYNLRRLR